MDMPESLKGKVLGGCYRLERLLAEGGASLVFQAERIRPPRREVVVKLLHPALSGDGETRGRLQLEAELLGRLSHDHIVELLDTGQTDDDLPYLVMEVLQGELLRARLDREGRLPPREVARLVGQAAEALQSLHDMGVAHRDVNPRTLFLQESPDGEAQVKLMDLGLALQLDARQGAAEEVLGSEGYMAAEQLRGEVQRVDATTDVFALAVVAYEALCGKRPYDAEDEEELLRQVCRAKPTPITARVVGLPPGINKVMGQALARDQGQRQGSVAELARGLATALEGAEVPPRQLSRRAQTPWWAPLPPLRRIRRRPVSRRRRVPSRPGRLKPWWGMTTCWTSWARTGDRRPESWTAGLQRLAERPRSWTAGLQRQAERPRSWTAGLQRQAERPQPWTAGLLPLARPGSCEEKAWGAPATRSWWTTLCWTGLPGPASRRRWARSSRSSRGAPGTRPRSWPGSSSARRRRPWCRRRPPRPAVTCP